MTTAHSNLSTLATSTTETLSQTTPNTCHHDFNSGLLHRCPSHPKSHNISSQNTAPAFDFKCFYTYDLRQKQKRWQDGLFRFHTFNKRVVVYNIPRHYIRATHRRDDKIIGDGDEFELDRGVLIQVGETARPQGNSHLPLSWPPLTPISQPSQPSTEETLGLRPARNQLQRA